MGRWKVENKLRFSREKFTLDFHRWFSYDAVP